MPKIEMFLKRSVLPGTVAGQRTMCHFMAFGSLPDRSIVHSKDFNVHRRQINVSRKKGGHPMFISGNTLLTFVGIGLLAGCAASTPSINTAIRQGPAVAAPTYRTGDQWAYQVVRSTGNNDTLRISYRNGKFENDNQATFDNYFAATVYRTDSDLKPLDFPLTPGKAWSYRYQGTSGRGRTQWRDAEVKVIGPTAQPVTTKAGKFKAVEIQRIETWGNAQRKSTYFYSPDTGSVVKMAAETVSPTTNVRVEMELVKYNGGR
jgi:hypothetical protein